MPIFCTETNPNLLNQSLSVTQYFYYTSLLPVWKNSIQEQKWFWKKAVFYYSNYYCSSSEKYFYTQGFSQGNLNLLCSEAVYQMIKCGNYNCIEYGEHFLLVHGQNRRRMKIHECPWSKENRNNNYMWATSTEDFGPSFSGTDAEDTGEDKIKLRQRWWGHAQQRQGQQTMRTTSSLTWVLVQESPRRGRMSHT